MKLPLKILLKYLALTISIFIMIMLWGFLYFQSTKNSENRYRDTRDIFYEQTAVTNLRDDVFISHFYATSITIFIVLPVLFFVDLFIRRKLLSSLILFPLLATATLLAIFQINSLFFKILEIRFGKPISNKDVVVLKKAWIESADTNNNQVQDTVKVYLTINGDRPENHTSRGLVAWGGVDICIYSPFNGLKSLTCEHFFHAENQDELEQDRLIIGVRGSYTYSFSVETSIDTNFKSYEQLKELRITADFTGADAPLVFYDTKVPNTIDFTNFENIGIQKLPNERGLH